MTADKKPRTDKPKEAAWELESDGEERRFRVRPAKKVKATPIVINDDESLEAEADAMGARAMRTKAEKPD